MIESRAPATPTDSRILDFRSRQTPANARDACEMKGGSILMREPRDVVAACLHQTACWYAVAGYQLRAAKGDEVLARHTRALGVHAHMTAMRHGRTVVAYSPLAYVNHGHLVNPMSVGIEHEGLYDVDGAPVRLPAGVDVGDIIDAGRAALSWLAEQLPGLRVVYAHRQSMRPGKGRAAKTSDPGARIFREVAVEHGVRKLGLTIEPDRVFGIGRPLPANWYV